MTNLSNAPTEELLSYETKLEVVNRIYLRERLNRLLADPNSDMKTIMTVIELLSDMVDQSLTRQKLNHADVKAQSRDRELSLAESKVEVQRESLAVARMKLEAKKVPASSVEPFESNPVSPTPSNIIVPAHLAGKQVTPVNGEKPRIANHLIRARA